MYEVVTYDEAAAALRELPEPLLSSYLEARASLELAPWTVGRSLKPSNPNANIYTLDITVSGAGEATIVHILEILWL